MSEAGNPPTGHNAAGSVTHHPLASSDHPPGFSSTFTIPQASLAHSPLSTAQNGSARAMVSSGLTQPVHDFLPSNKHQTWSSEGEDETPLQIPEEREPPGYGPPGSGDRRRQTPAASSSRATGNNPAQAGTDLPPGFAGRVVNEQSYLRGSVGMDSDPDTMDLPPGFAPSREPLTPSNQRTQHSDVDQPPGFSQTGMMHLNAPVSAAIAHTPKPAETPASVKSSATTGRKGRTQASTASSPTSSARASQLPAAAASVSQAADLPPGFSASSSPSFHPADRPPNGILPTRSHGRAPSSRLQITAAGPFLAGIDERPPGFDTAGGGASQVHTQAPQQQVAGALQPQRSVQGVSEPQQLLQQTPQEAAPHGNVSLASASVSDNHPPGFPAMLPLPDPAVQSASKQWQPSSSQGNLPSTSAAVGDNLPPGFHAQSRSPAPAVKSASGRPIHAPKIVNLARLSSAPAAQSSTRQPSPLSAADDLPPGFPSAASAASVSHPSSFQPQSSTPASAAHDVPPGFSTAPLATAASVNHPSSSQTRPASASPYQVVDGQSGWDTDETKPAASTHHPQSHGRHAHASAADDDRPPGFLNPTQQPASASASGSASGALCPPSSVRSQRQPLLGAPVLERKVSVTNLPTNAISGVSSAFATDAPVQAERSVTVTKPAASSRPGPHSTAPTAPHVSSNSKRRSHGQAITQSSAAAAAGDSSPDLPPGFSTMHRSSSTPSRPTVTATVSRATAVQAPGSKVAAEQSASSSAAADLPPGFVRLGAAPQGPVDLPPGFPADSASAHAPKVSGVPSSSKKEAGRRAQVPLPQSGLQRSDARRKAQTPKVRCILHMHLATT